MDTGDATQARSAKGPQGLGPLVRRAEGGETGASEGVSSQGPCGKASGHCPCRDKGKAWTGPRFWLLVGSPPPLPGVPDIVCWAGCPHQGHPRSRLARTPPQSPSQAEPPRPRGSQPGPHLLQHVHPRLEPLYFLLDLTVRSWGGQLRSTCLPGSRSGRGVSVEYRPP